VSTPSFSRLFLAKEKALGIMAQGDDPFHDDKHALEVAATAKKIYDSLTERKKTEVNWELVELACLFHDSSRKIIKHNLFLVPIFDEIFSGHFAYKTLLKIGYSRQQANEVKQIIRGYGVFFGLFRRESINSLILSDADKVEVYNPQRFIRGLDKFEKRQFPQYLLNLLIIAVLFLNKKILKLIRFQKAKDIQQVYWQNLLSFLAGNKRRLSKLLYRPVSHYLDNYLKEKTLAAKL
jgi:hypothetical protein